MTAPRRLPPALAAALLVVTVCGAASRAHGQDPPKRRQISYYYDAFDQSVVRPMTRVLDPALWVHKVTGTKKEALNVDEQDAVHLPSTWWQPRLGFRPVSVEQMLRGPGPGTGPSRETKWRISRLKTQGVSPGFQIKDATGRTFQIKFDPPGNPELASGADVVVTYLLWAAGYNVPDNVIVNFHLDELEIAEGATFEDPLGREHPITWEVLQQTLRRSERNADSSYRAVASRFLPGKPLGEWRFEGRRKDDPEDRIPHEHRREIRGLWTVAAWVNHADGSARNTLDMWVEDGGRKFVRHHLIDFSGCLGSASIAPHSPRTGHEYLMDYGTAARSLVTLGLLPYRWESARTPELRGVGFFESKTFDPEGWRPYLPNPAYDERTERDMRWGARIVAAFTDDHIRAAVEQGKYTDPRATEYLTGILIERRDKLVRRWLGGPVATAQP
jgi:hypothetical protein